MKGRKLVVRQVTLFDLDDICVVDQEAFGQYGTAEDREIFARRLTACPAGFSMLAAGDETVTL